VPDPLDVIATCGLGAEELEAQRGRYRRLGATVEAVERNRGSLVVRFGHGLDRYLLDETVGVERGCCPFFTFDFSAADGVLRIGVERTDQEPALDALAFALGVGASEPSRD